MNQLLTRRHFLQHTSQGLGGIALASLLAREGLLATEGPIRPRIDVGKPFASRKPHFKPKANKVLVIFSSGACSQLDTFDYKPAVAKDNGKSASGYGNRKLLESPWKFPKRG